MEIIIVICLLIVIVLLLQEKIIIKKDHDRKLPDGSAGHNLPRIMGESRQARSRSASGNTSIRSIQESNNDPDTSEIESAGILNDRIQIPQEELDEVFSEVADLDEEEEEWIGYGEPNGEDGFATGVTFEELSIVGTLLQQDVPEPVLQEQAIGIVQKIQGTELLSHLENAIENASQKIASLLDSSLLSEPEASSLSMRNKDLDGFDIGEFI